MTKKIAYLTDSHLDEQFPKDHGIDARENWNRVLQDLKERNMEEVVFGGDIGSPESNEWFFSTLKDFQLSLTPGNHDTFDELSKHLSTGANQHTREFYYSKEDANYKYLYLDTSSGRISQNQIEWTERELVSDKKIVLFIHHPVIPVPSEMDLQYPLGNRENLSEALKNSDKALTLFCGHYHFDDTRIEENITQIITPSTCFPVEKIIGEVKVITDEFGYRIIEFDQEKISSELIMLKR